LEDGKVPGLETRTAQRVPSCIAERAEGRIHECAGIEKSSWYAGRSIRIGYLVRPLLSVRLRSGRIRTRHCKPATRGERCNATHLPAAEDAIGGAGCVGCKMLAVPEWQLVEIAQHEAMPNVEVGVSVFPLRMSAPAVAVVVLRSEVGVRSFIE